MLNVDKVITLGNGDKYLVLDKILYNDVDYYYIAKVNETSTDIENDFKLISVNEVDGHSVIVEVTGEDRLKDILPKFDKE